MRPDKSPTAQLVGTAIAYRVGRAHIGVLLEGRPGSGKSSLALQAIRQSGARLIGDDALLVQQTRNGLTIRSAPRLAGLLHVVGVGIAPMAYMRSARLCLIVELVARTRQPQLAQPRTRRVLGQAVPCLRLAAFDIGVVERLELAAHRIGQCGIVPKNAILPPAK